MQNHICTPKRIELKEVFRPSDIFYFKSKLKTSSLRFFQHYPTRRINSIYFDSINFESLEESIEGSSKRTKIRLRWYGKEKSTSSATLELKRKQGLFSWKDLFLNEFKITPNATTWDDLISQEKRTELNSYRFIKSKLPVSIISYDREYYCSMDGKVRVTIDSNLKSFDQRNNISPNLKFKRNFSNQIIVEAKVNASDEKHLKTFHQELPFSCKRFSKYCESLLPQKNI